jgi:hypothetical protein
MGVGPISALAGFLMLLVHLIQAGCRSNVPKGDLVDLEVTDIRGTRDTFERKAAGAQPQQREAKGLAARFSGCRNSAFATIRNAKGYFRAARPLAVDPCNA